jgi:hypothetical protein
VSALEAESTELFMCDLMYQLDCLDWFVTARVVYHFDHYQFIPRRPDMRSDLRRAAGDAKKQLRCAVFPMDAQCEAFLDVFHLQQQRWL